MASREDFVTYVCDQLAGAGAIRSRKMFGDYCVYVDEKPVILVCNDTVYLKRLPELETLLAGAPLAPPYSGAKDHYVLDIDNGPLCREAAALAASLTPLPKKKPRKKF